MLDPTELLRALIRFDTTNPPGAEAACVKYVADRLLEHGIAPQIFARDPDRPNLLALIPGRGLAPPLLLHGHLDVVTTAGQRWTHPPFAADVADGYVWGRGALDMKGGVAMLTAAFAACAADPPPGDLLLCLMVDEEQGSDCGAKFLVERHPDLFGGVRHALSEFGGFTLQVGPARCYPISVAEKQICRLRATVRGAAGHGSIPTRTGVMARLSRVLRALHAPLPLHVTPVARAFLGGIAAQLGPPGAVLAAALLNPVTGSPALRLLGARGAALAAMLRHTANPTVLRAGDQINVAPAEAVLELDGRILPGYTPADLLAELRPRLGADVALEVTRFDPGPSAPDMTLLPLLGAVLTEQDPGTRAVPMLLTGVTDGRFFSRLGIQTYGFTPMQLPPELNFLATLHAADERIPVAALPFGTRAIGDVIRRYRG